MNKILQANLGRGILLLISLISFLLPTGNEARASHAMGVDVSYECIGSNSYIFTVELYRDCFGVAPGSTTSLNFSSASICDAPFSAVLSIVNMGGTEVSQVCPAQIDSTNCSFGGSIPGTEVWTYQGTVTFPSSCTDWMYTWSLCCRNSQITNITNPASSDLFIDGLVNTTVCNNSPQFVSIPTPYICMGQPFCYSLGTSDPENDSLVFTLTQPLTGAGAPIAYVGGHTISEPLTSSVPWTFNSVNGQFCFTPDIAQNGVVKIQIDEYRSGALIGTSSRELQIIVQSCTNQ